MFIALCSSQCPMAIMQPKRHEQALLQIGHYLKGILDNGLTLHPMQSFTLDCYPNADSARLWKYKDSIDPHCIQSCTGYILALANCPINWASKMQTEIALSIMEVEYIALSTTYHDLFLHKYKLDNMKTILSLDFTSGSNIHALIHEDNIGALILGILKP